MALSVCWLFDAATDRVVRRLWQRLEESGVGTLQSHTHGRHVPHLTIASLTSYDAIAVRDALLPLAADVPVPAPLDGLGMFRRSRTWLAPTVSVELLGRQAAVLQAVASSGAVVHPHYRTGQWLPHVTLAPRLRLQELPVVAQAVNEVLPLPAVLSSAALVDTGTGEVDPLPNLL